MMLLGGLAAVILAGSADAAVPSDSTVIADMRNFAVSRIDSTLGAGTLDSWLKRVLGPGSALSWEANDCGEGTDGPNTPICVSADGRLPPRGRVIVMMVVGNEDREVAGLPALWFAEIQGIGPSEEVKRLADLPAKLRKLRALEEQLSRLPNRPLDDSTAIRFVERMSARQLSDSLPDVRFGDWMAALAGRDARVTWKLEGCDRTRASMDELQDYWACVQVSFDDPRVRIGVDIRVGTLTKGLFDAPYAHRISVYDKRGAHISVDTKLDDLPGAIEAIRRRP